MAPDPLTLTWTSPRGGPTAKSRTASATTSSGARVRVQTPPMAVQVYKNAGSTTLILTPSGSDTDGEFVRFVAAYDAAAAAQTAEWTGVLAARPTMGQGMRLMAWDDAQFFDADGVFCNEPPPDMRACSCLLEFGGVWLNGVSWGAKWRVVQVRAVQASAIGPARPPPAPVCAFSD